MLNLRNLSRRDRALNSRRRRLNFSTQGSLALAIEFLEPRMMLAAGDVLSGHNGNDNNNVNALETVLTTSNVKSATFGKIFGTTLDGQIYAQPLVKTNVNVTAGSAQGIHNVVYVASMHDSLYALDSNSGAILWQDSFTGSTIVPRLSGETISTLPQSDTQTTTISVEVGILSTPVIDPASNLIFLLAVTKESRYKDPLNQGLGKDTHYVQRLYGVDLGSGAVVRQTVVGDTIYNGTIDGNFNGYQYVAGPVINGTGNNGPVTVNGVTTQYTDGWIVNSSGYSPQAQGQLAFNALLEMNRPALTLLNGVIYLGFASHGDKGPYYGWLLGYRTSDLANVVAFNTVPNHEDIIHESIIENTTYVARAGFWTGGAPIASDGTYLYISTGNGTFNQDPSNFDPNYFTMDGTNKVLLPKDNAYGDSIVKLLPDPTVLQTISGGMWTNGFGLKVVDYFTPTNVYMLNKLDYDLGSSSPTILPDSAAVTIDGVTYNHLMISGGKEGRIYLINRDNMGGFNYDTGYPFTNTSPPFVDPRLYDRTLGEDPVGGTNATSGDRIVGAASYFNGQFYIGVASQVGWSFTPQGFAYATLPNPSSSSPPNPSPAHTTSDTINSSGGQFSISANGTANCIAWVLSPSGSGSETLIAYNAATLASLYKSGSLTGGGTKFTAPTISNGLVYAGTATSLVAYGLTPLALNAPTSFAALPVLNGKKIHLTWTRNTTSEAETLVERSTDGTNWTALTYLPNGANSYDDTTVVTGTHYFYRITAINGLTKSTSVTVSTNTTLNYTRGDFNLDGTVTGADISAMLGALVDLNAYTSARKINSTDLNLLGDYSGDRQVTNLDIQGLLDAVAAAPGGGSASAESLVQTAAPTAANVQTPLIVSLADTLNSTQPVAGPFIKKPQPQSTPVQTEAVRGPLPKTQQPALHASDMLRSRYAVGTKPAASTQILEALFASWD